jgi:multidrug efflux pump
VARASDGNEQLLCSFSGKSQRQVNNLIAGLNLRPWEQRERSQMQIQQELQQQLDGLAGLQAVAINFPSLPGASGLPVQFVVSSTDRFENVYEVSQALLREANQSGLFIFMDTDLKYNNPQLQMNIDREKADELGIEMSDIGTLTFGRTPWAAE